MKKKLYCLQQWLNRLNVAYNKNELTSAMAEADSLFAELDGIRDELWFMVESEAVSHSWKRTLLGTIPRLCAIMLLSFFIICTAICSITQDVTQVAKSGPIKVAQEVQTDSMKTTSRFTTISVNNILKKVRKNKNSKSVATLNNAKNNAKHVKSCVKVGTNKSVMSKLKDDEQKSSEMLLTLVQVGEQTLRDNSGNNFIIKKSKKLQSKEQSL